AAADDERGRVGSVTRDLDGRGPRRRRGARGRRRRRRARDLGRRDLRARGRVGRGALLLRLLKLALVDVDEGRVLDRAQALRDLVGLLEPAQFDVGAAEPEEHQVGDEAVGVVFEEVAEDRGRLVVLPLGEERAPAVENVLLGLRGRVVLLRRERPGGRADGGGEGGEDERGGERGRADSIPRAQFFSSGGQVRVLSNCPVTSGRGAARLRVKLWPGRAG